jgi:pimeloyl-ACP methyl ester carboxylesterase
MRHLARPALFRLYPASYQVRALLGRSDVRGVRHLVAQAHAAAGAEALACRARATMVVDTAEELRSCPVPVMYLRATEDRLIAGSRAEEARRILPSLRVMDMPGPHLALVTDPQAAWRAIAAFMEEPL